MARKRKILAAVKWNFVRKKSQGERYLRMAGAADVAAAKVLWKDPATPEKQRCFAALAIGLIGPRGPKWRMEGIDGSPRLERARELGNKWAERHKQAEERLKQHQEAAAKMEQLGITSAEYALALLQDRSQSEERRESAANILANLRYRNAVDSLIDALAEGQQKLSWMCMWALTRIGSRRGARRLIEIARRSKSLVAKQEAVYTTRGGSLHLSLGCD